MVWNVVWKVEWNFSIENSIKVNLLAKTKEEPGL